MSNAYGPARVTLGSTDLRTTDQVAFRTNQQRYRRHGGGSLHAGFDGVLRQPAVFEYQTTDLRRILAVCDGVEVPEGRAAMTATWATNAVDSVAYASAISRAATTCHHFITTLSFQRGEPAMARVNGFPLSSDGDTNPVTNGTPAVPAQITDAEEWVVKTVTLNAVEIQRWQSIDIEIDAKATVDADQCYRSQRPFPVFVASGGIMGGVDISVTIQAMDLAQALAANTAVPLVIVLGNKLRGSPLFGADEITITGIPGMVDFDLIDGSPSSRPTTIPLIHDGTSRPLTIAGPA